jgi:sigma-B regulation protein RsbU (phosphoserine phosphatase)
MRAALPLVESASSLPAFRTVRGRLLFWILAVVVPIYAAAMYMSYRSAAERLEVGAERDADELAARLAAELDAVIRPIEGGIRTVAAQLEEIDPPREQYEARIRGILAAWPDVYGSTIAVETGEHVSSGPFAPYFFRRNGAVAYSDLALDSYSYQTLPWYRRAADGLQPVWSSPYFDAGGGETWMVTYSVPFFRRVAGNPRALAGVVTADLDLNWVGAAASRAPVGSIGMGWLVSPPGTESFAAPIGATNARSAAFDASLDDRTFSDVGERMLASGVTFALLSDRTAEPVYLAVRALETLDWRLLLVVPRAQLLGEARALLGRQLVLGAAGLALLIGAISLVAAGISRPIHALAASVDGARDGNFNFWLPETKRHDEVGVLTVALRRMRDSLQRHIELRAEDLAARARLEHELSIAASIQQSLLPQRAADAHPTGARVAAALLPAKQVGGDLYDYFERNSGLLFAIGDVSDKGIPAALFMANVSGLFKVLGSAGELPERLLARVNERLAASNDACMFATMGCGFLEVDTGLLRYASAGHDPPLLRELGGNVEPLRTENGPALAIETPAAYPLTERRMAPGDTLLMFTDGVTEAAAADGSLFGLERLCALLRDSAGSAEPEALVRRIVEAVTAHAADFHATDDLTVLAVTFAPSEVASSRRADGEQWLIEPEFSPEGCRRARHWLRVILGARWLADELIADAELIAEELLTNVVRAAGSSAGEPWFSLELALTPAAIVLTVCDNGPEFDPLSRETPNLDADIEERGVGGLGIHLVRELADDCRYARIDDHNVLRIRLDRKTT